MLRWQCMQRGERAHISPLHVACTTTYIASEIGSIYIAASYRWTYVQVAWYRRSYNYINVQHDGQQSLLRTALIDSNTLLSAAGDLTSVTADVRLAQRASSVLTVVIELILYYWSLSGPHAMAVIRSNEWSFCECINVLRVLADLTRLCMPTAIGKLTVILSDH